MRHNDYRIEFPFSIMRSLFDKVSSTLSDVARTRAIRRFPMWLCQLQSVRVSRRTPRRFIPCLCLPNACARPRAFLFRYSLTSQRVSIPPCSLLYRLHNPSANSATTYLGRRLAVPLTARCKACARQSKRSQRAACECETSKSSASQRVGTRNGREPQRRRMRTTAGPSTAAPDVLAPGENSVDNEEIWASF